MRQELTGRGVAELQAPPRCKYFKTIAQVLNEMKETGTWPLPLTCGLISLIQKGEGSAPQKMRPIGLVASVCRLWALLADSRHHALAREMADTALYGYRPGRRACGRLDGSFDVCQICTC